LYVAGAGSGVTIFAPQLDVHGLREPMTCDTANALPATVTIARMISNPPATASCEPENRRSPET
jgi:hypothetical protein